MERTKKRHTKWCGWISYKWEPASECILFTEIKGYKWPTQTTSIIIYVRLYWFVRFVRLYGWLFYDGYFWLLFRLAIFLVILIAFALFFCFCFIRMRKFQMTIYFYLNSLNYFAKRKRKRGFRLPLPSFCCVWLCVCMFRALLYTFNIHDQHEQKKRMSGNNGKGGKMKIYLRIYGDLQPVKPHYICWQFSCFVWFCLQLIV